MLSPHKRLRHSEIILSILRVASIEPNSVLYVANLYVSGLVGSNKIGIIQVQDDNDLYDIISHH